ncbi:MAG: T9SS type A sorting domain-containing protein [Candidatus Cloacimonetes bacterium]|nr:T9SS type A sorting domain-containing protein [Candidatus Cloacimonadota bacterium]
MKRIVLFFLLFIAVSLWGIVIPAGNVHGNWTIADSPYFIDGNITIVADATLEIEAGVEIYFNDVYSLVVNGRLLAVGTETDSILISCIEASLGWQGIRFYDTNTNGLEGSILQYCHLEKGTAIGTGDDANGGAVYCNNSGNVLIENCYFFQNYSAWDGGAVYLGNGSDNLVTNCLFTANSCGFYGAGMIVYGSAPVLERCDFIGNSSSVFAAGFSAWNNAAPELYNCRFIDNFAGACAGIYGVSSTITLANVLFINNNTQYGSGGAIGLTSCNTAASNVTIIDNESTLSGGAFWINSGHLDLYNSILWGNLPEEIALAGTGSATVSNCCIQDGFEGDNILEDDPLFLDAAEYDLHLEETSPCIDYGDATLPEFTLPEFDFDGLARIMDGDGDGDAQIDLGIYEYEFIMFYEPPAHLNIEATTGFVTWEAPSQEGLTGYCIYLDGDMLAEITETEYQLTGLIDGVEYIVALKAMYEGGESELVTATFIYIQTAAGEDELAGIINHGNYPNPFNPSTQICFTTLRSGIVDLTVYNLQGKRVINLINGELAAGIHQINWNGKDESNKVVGSGVYLYKIQTVSTKVSGRMILLK